MKGPGFLNQVPAVGTLELEIGSCRGFRCMGSVMGSSALDRCYNEGLFTVLRQGPLLLDWGLVGFLIV